jgi:hypothetical protein
MCALPFHNMVGHEISLKSVDNFRLLRKKGITIRKTIDVLIVTYSIENQLILLHSDKDFQPFQRGFTNHLKRQVKTKNEYSGAKVRRNCLRYCPIMDAGTPCSALR